MEYLFPTSLLWHSIGGNRNQYWLRRSGWRRKRPRCFHWESCCRNGRTTSGGQSTHQYQQQYRECNTYHICHFHASFYLTFKNMQSSFIRTVFSSVVRNNDDNRAQNNKKKKTSLIKISSLSNSVQQPLMPNRVASAQ